MHLLHVDRGPRPCSAVPARLAPCFPYPKSKGSNAILLHARLSVVWSVRRCVPLVTATVWAVRSRAKQQCQEPDIPVVLMHEAAAWCCTCSCETS